MAQNRKNCLPGLRTGEWVKGKVVGSGSFGTVNLAMSKATGALFVVKSAQSGAGLESLKNEAKILQTLDSPYIVRCIGKEEDSSKKFSIFMEFMSGGSLSDVGEKFGGSLDEDVIRLYTREILHGLNYLHKNGIVHCDVKCKNVLLDSSGSIKLADFGCAKRVCLTQQCGKKNIFVGGTPLWMAPEVLRNEGQDFASDIWSLGCTIIEMATGRPPWTDNNDQEVSNSMAAVLKIACGNSRPKFPNNFSKEGFDFLEKCLERNPGSRWTAEELLNHPFVFSGNSTQKEKEGGASSPASVFDIRVEEEEEEGYDSDESESSSGDECPCRNPFSARRCCGDRKRIVKKRWVELPAESVFMSSENWITVRSG